MVILVPMEIGIFANRIIAHVGSVETNNPMERNVIPMTVALQVGVNLGEKVVSPMVAKDFVDQREKTVNGVTMENAYA